MQRGGYAMRSCMQRKVCKKFFYDKLKTHPELKLSQHIFSRAKFLIRLNLEGMLIKFHCAPDKLSISFKLVQKSSSVFKSAMQTEGIQIRNKKRRRNFVL